MVTQRSEVIAAIPCYADKAIWNCTFTSNDHLTISAKKLLTKTLECYVDSRKTNQNTTKVCGKRFIKTFTKVREMKAKITIKESFLVSYLGRNNGMRRAPEILLRSVLWSDWDIECYEINLRKSRRN